MVRVFLFPGLESKILVLFVLVQHGTTAVTAFRNRTSTSPVLCVTGFCKWLISMGWMLAPCHDQLISTGHPFRCRFSIHEVLIHVDPSSSVVLPGSAIEPRWLHTKLLRGEGPLSLLPDSCWHIALDEPALRVLSKALVYGDHFASFCNMTFRMHR